MDDATPQMPTRLADRAVLRVAGEDVRGFLQGLVTQDMAAVAPGRPAWSGLLTPQGKALFDFVLWADGDAILIDCEGEQAEALARRLTLYRLRRAITIARDDALAAHWSADAPDRPADPRLFELGRRWLAPAGDVGDASEAWRAHRLSLGVCEGVAELGQDATLWLECNARELCGVSFTKGCYVGQENTARMHHRAKVSRRLLVVPLGEAGPRTRARYPELGVMVELRRLDALGDAVLPVWVGD
ncbi:CAF17-like 4Fe-4S cluster assembly/insertion protein YgfZ [Sphingomonas baiyangensis]|uniref:Folate-binding protein YgfZ n=1 Tax=Sphingomonas baiyangensis TaxID=2572576 RepID=A0A4U1L2P3_9SPHN|nr:folate-binding protein YgfZ [Sphingomonas baiyangensis]TKD51129.1 folate-binding protein YgfZ [Sphingomonas baiyangensis]